MGRPRKKRKYTRRNLGTRTVDGPTEIVAIEVVSAARALNAKVKALLASADPAVARVAVMELIPDLQWVAKFNEHETAPAP